MDGLECAQESHEGRRQLFQGGYLRSEEGVSSAFWLSEEEERGQAGRLELVGDIGVPDCGGDGVVVFEVEGLFQVPKFNMSSREALDNVDDWGNTCRPGGFRDSLAGVLT